VINPLEIYSSDAELAKEKAKTTKNAKQTNKKTETKKTDATGKKGTKKIEGNTETTIKCDFITIMDKT